MRAVLLLLGVCVSVVFATPCSGNTVVPTIEVLGSAGGVSNPVPYDGVSNYGSAANVCRWNLQADGMGIRLRASAPSLTCGDYLLIYDSSDNSNSATLLVNQTCGGPAISTTAISASAYVEFIGSGGAGATGFNITYTAVQLAKCMNGACPSIDVLPGSGYFSYPPNYPNAPYQIDRGATCGWQFMVPAGYTALVRLTHDMNKCGKLSIVAYPGDNYESIDIQPTPDPYHPVANPVIFNSGDSSVIRVSLKEFAGDCHSTGNHTGFRLDYTVFPTPSITTTGCSPVVNLGPNPTSGVFSSHTPWNNQTLTVNGAYFCRWNITAAPGKFPAVRFTAPYQFNSYRHYQTLIVYDGPDDTWSPLWASADYIRRDFSSSGYYSEWIIGRGSSLTIIFYSSTSNTLGFQMEYSTTMTAPTEIPGRCFSIDYSGVPSSDFSSSPYYIPTDSTDNFNAHLQVPIFHGINGTAPGSLLCQWYWAAITDQFQEYTVSVDALDMAPGAIFYVSTSYNVFDAPTMILTNSVKSSVNKGLNSFPTMFPLVANAQQIVVAYYSGTGPSQGVRATVTKTPWHCPDQCNGRVTPLSGSYGTIHAPCNQSLEAPFTCQYLITVPAGKAVRLNYMRAQHEGFTIAAYDGPNNRSNQLYQAYPADIPIPENDFYDPYSIGPLFMDPTRSVRPRNFMLTAGNVMFVEITVTNFLTSATSHGYPALANAVFEYHAVGPSQCGSQTIRQYISLREGMMGVLQVPAPYTGTLHTDPNQVCTWTLHPEASFYPALLVITVDAINFAPTDFLQLFYKDQRGNSPDTRPRTLTAQDVGTNITFEFFGSVSLDVNFATHRLTTGYGFKLSYKLIYPEVNCDPRACKGYDALTVSIPIDGSKIYFGRPCPFTGTDGVVRANETCRWQVVPAVPGYSVSVRLQWLRLDAVLPDRQLLFCDPLSPLSTGLLYDTDAGGPSFTGSEGTAVIYWNIPPQSVPAQAYGWVASATVGPAVTTCRSGITISGDPVEYSPVQPFGLYRMTGSCSNEIDMQGFNVSFTLLNYSLIAGETLELIEQNTPWGEQFSRTLTAADVGKTFYRMSWRALSRGMILKVTSPGPTHGFGFNMLVGPNDRPIIVDCDANIESFYSSSSSTVYKDIVNVTATSGLGTFFGFPCPYDATDDASEIELRFTITPPDSSSSAGVIIDDVFYRQADYLVFYDGAGPPAPGQLPFFQLIPEYSAPYIPGGNTYACQDGVNPQIVAPSGSMYVQMLFSHNVRFLARAISVPGRKPQQCTSTLYIRPDQSGVIQSPIPYDGVTTVTSRAQCRWYINCASYVGVRLTLITMNMPSYDRPVIIIQQVVEGYYATVAVWNTSTPAGTSYTFAENTEAVVTFNAHQTYPADKGFQIQVERFYAFLLTETTQCVDTNHHTQVIRPLIHADGTGDHGIINYPCPFYLNQTHGPNVNATWMIIPPAGYLVMFNPLRISYTRPSTYLIIGEGTDFANPITPYYYGDSEINSPITTHARGTPMLVNFITPSSSSPVPGGGFVGTYSLFKPDSQTGSYYTPDYCNAIYYYYGSEFTDGAASVQQPNEEVSYTWVYPNPNGLALYRPQDACTFLWCPEEGVGNGTHQIRATLHYANLGKGDFLFFYDAQHPRAGPLIAEIGPGTHINVVLPLTTSGFLSVHFLADHDFNVGTGFNITFDITPAFAPPREQPTPPCPAETIINVTDIGQVVRYPPWGYDHYYNLEAICVWKLVAPVGKQIDVTFLYEDIGSGYSGYERVAVYDSEYVDNRAYKSYYSSEDASFTYYGRNGILPEPFEHATTSSNFGTIFFQAKGDANTNHGWAFVVSLANAVTPDCSDTCQPTQTNAQALATPAAVSGTHGYISAPCPYSVNDYYVGVTCAYLITVPTGMVVSITIADVNGETPILLYNGATTASPLITSVTEAGPMSYMSTGHQMLVTWDDGRYDASIINTYYSRFSSYDHGQSYYAAWAAVVAPPSPPPSPPPAVSTTATSTATATATATATTDATTTDTTGTGAATTGSSSPDAVVNADQGSSGGLSGGAVAGIVIVVLLVVIGAAVAVAVVLRAKKGKAGQSVEQPMTTKTAAPVDSTPPPAVTPAPTPAPTSVTPAPAAEPTPAPSPPSIAATADPVPSSDPASAPASTV